MAPSRALLDEDEDPITAEYDIFITPPTSSSLYLLQFPTRRREDPYNEAYANAPLELRIKPGAGFLEMDVPLNTVFNHDKDKAQTWGSALTRAKGEGAHGHGLAAGFAHNAGLRATPATQQARRTAGAGAGAGPGRARAAQPETEEHEAGTEEHSMAHQTLGGQIIKDERGAPNYMIGAFRGSELHLTPVTGLVQMRPQFHHLDAKTQVDRNRARRDREAAEAPRPVEARIVQMMQKSGGGGGGDSDNLDAAAESTKEYLQKAQEEAWTRLRFCDEEVEEAYTAYHEHLFLDDTATAPKLVASMNNEQYLDAISAPRLDPSGRHIMRPLFRKQRAPQVHVSEGSDEDEEDEVEGVSRRNGEVGVNGQGGEDGAAGLGGDAVNGRDSEAADGSSDERAREPLDAT